MRDYLLNNPKAVIVGRTAEGLPSCASPVSPRVGLPIEVDRKLVSGRPGADIADPEPKH